jgi:hypothetical protein
LQPHVSACQLLPLQFKTPAVCAQRLSNGLHSNPLQPCMNLSATAIDHSDAAVTKLRQPAVRAQRLSNSLHSIQLQPSASRCH